MRTKRPARPLNQAAVKTANEAVSKQYGLQPGTELTPGKQDEAARKRWKDAYEAALSKLTASSSPPTVAPVLIAPCPAVPVADPSPCSGAHPCRGQGLDDRKNRDEYMQDVRALREKLRKGSVTPEQFATELQMAVNKQLAKSGTPPVAFEDSSRFLGFGNRFEPELYGQYAYTSHRMTVNKELLALDPADPNFDDKFKGLVGTAYHEARHAEQFQRAADHLANNGSTASDLEDLGFTPQVASAATKAAGRKSAGEYRCGTAIYESIFGTGRAHREKVLGPDKEKADAELKAAKKELDDAAQGLKDASYHHLVAKKQSDTLSGEYSAAQARGAVGWFLEIRTGRAMEREQEAFTDLARAQQRFNAAKLQLASAEKASFLNWKFYESLPEESDAHCQSNIISRDL